MPNHTFNSVQELQKLVTPSTKIGADFDTIVKNVGNQMRHSANQIKITEGRDHSRDSIQSSEQFELRDRSPATITITDNERTGRKQKTRPATCAQKFRTVSEGGNSSVDYG